MEAWGGQSCRVFSYLRWTCLSSNKNSHSLHTCWSSPQEEENQRKTCKLPTEGPQAWFHNLDLHFVPFCDSSLYLANTNTVLFCIVMVIGAFHKAWHSTIHTHWSVAAAGPTGSSLGHNVSFRDLLTCGQSRPKFKPHWATRSTHWTAALLSVIEHKVALNWGSEVHLSSPQMKTYREFNPLNLYGTSLDSSGGPYRSSSELIYITDTIYDSF